jgi:LmbE family N-acetylglucosaminyl deacetylase
VIVVLRSDSIIAVGAHPDDVELGCGGTLAAATAAGKKIAVVYLTKGEKSGDPEGRVAESKKALKILGVTQVYFGDFPDTEIPASHKVVEFLEEILEKHQAETVLTHSTHDSHQDHRQVGWLSLSAFRNVSRILAYETPRVTGDFSPTYFIDISKYVHSKWDSLTCHCSQKSKRYLAYESMINLASFRGSQVNLGAAEAFEVLRYVEKTL